MTDKLHCPFCGAELEEALVQWGDMPAEWRCTHQQCFKKYGDPAKEIWQALIDGKKAQDVLKGIVDKITDIRDAVQSGYNETEDIIPTIGIAIEYLDELKKEIASITKGENNARK